MIRVTFSFKSQGNVVLYLNSDSKVSALNGEIDAVC